MKQGPYRTDLLNNIVEVTVKAAEVENFKAFMIEYLPATAAFQGCEFVYLMQALADSQKFFFFETWESLERLNAYHAWRGPNKLLAEMFEAPPKVHRGRGIFFSAAEIALSPLTGGEPSPLVQLRLTSGSTRAIMLGPRF